MALWTRAGKPWHDELDAHNASAEVHGALGEVLGVYDFYRERGGSIASAVAAATRVVPIDAAALAVSAAAAGRAPLYVDTTKHTLTGKTIKLNLQAVLSTNDTAPATTFAFSLYPVATVAGASGLNSITFGTQIAASIATITTPAANTVTKVDSGDFTMPATGLYVIAVNNAGTVATGGDVAFRVTLWQRWT